MLWALSDFTEGNGATRFLPGSHRWPLVHNGSGADIPPGIEDLKHTVQATMTQGSVVIWTGGVLHGASAHAPRTTADEVEDTTRHSLLHTYHLGYLSREQNFHYAMPRAVLESFEPRLRDLIGLAGENAAEHEWYTGPIYTLPYLGGPNETIAGDGVQY